MSLLDYGREHEERQLGLLPRDHGARRVGESEAAFIDRRGREAAERAARHDAEIERHRREGTHVPGASVAGDYSIQDRANGRGGA